MRGFEVDGVCWASLGGSTGEVDGLWGNVVGVFDLRGCAENRNAWRESRHGLIRRDEGGCCGKLAVADVCVKPLIGAGITQNMVFRRFVAEQGADSFERCRARAGESPCGCDGCAQGIITSGAGADEHEVERLDVAVRFLKSFKKSSAASTRVVEVSVMENLATADQYDAAGGAGALDAEDRHG